MGDENWDDDEGTVAPAPASGDIGMGFGFGRGFKPSNQNKFDNNQSHSSSGFGTLDNSGGDDRRPGDRGGYENNSFGTSRGFKNNSADFGSKAGFRDSNDADFGNSNSFQNNGGYGGSSGFNNDNNDGGYGGSRGFGGDNKDSKDGGGYGGSRGFGGDSGDGGYGGSRGFDDDGGERRGGRGGRGGGRGRGRGGGGGYNRDDDNGGGFGGSKGFNNRDDNDGGFGGSRGFDDDGGNDRRGGRGGGRGGRGRGGGGFNRDGGGFNNRDDDNDGGFGGSKGFGNRDDNDGGYGRSRGFDDDGGSDRRGGRGGGRGGRGRGGGGFNRDNNDDGGFGNNDNDGGFGGRGDDRGRRNEDGKDDKPREIYIPPDQPDDDETLFGSGVSAGINFTNYFKIDVKVSGDDVPKPIETFEEADLRVLLNENIKKSHYTTPTPIQKYGIPIILGKRDLMACAQTGSGKTAAFLIPIIHTLLAKSRDFSDMSSANEVEPRALIISPTRELTIQIHQESLKFSRGSVLKNNILYGGAAVGHQLKQIFRGTDILVATPGRLLDMVGKGKVTFNSVEFVVLDEADRMLDMGFIGDIEKVLRHDTMVPVGERQTLMFSATFPEEIQELAAKFLNNYVFVTVGIVGSACADIEQNFIEAKKSEKRTKLKEVLMKEMENGSYSGTLIFVNEKKTTDYVAALLSEDSIPSTSIHGDRLQREREEALNSFKHGKHDILVATSVAARGLDMRTVRHVINYDLPSNIDEYIHRIGRTGRVGNRGKATSFYDPRYDDKLQGDLVRILKTAGQQVPDWLESGAGQGSYNPSDFGGQDIRNFPASSGGGTKPVDEEEEW